MTITAERIRELLNYDAETGLFTWRVARGRSAAGATAGSRHVNGYVCINIDGRGYGAHRLAWLHAHGHTPQVVDHINGERSDNRLANLRDVTYQVNAENRKGARAGKLIPLMGVRKQSRSGTYTASIKVNGKVLALGGFKTAEEAHSAYMAAKAEHHSGSLAAQAKLTVLEEMQATRAAA